LYLIQNSQTVKSVEGHSEKRWWQPQKYKMGLKKLFEATQLPYVQVITYFGPHDYLKIYIASNYVCILAQFLQEFVSKQL